MSTRATTAISTPAGDRPTSAVDSQPAARRSLSRRNGTPLPLTRLVSVEVRKNFDTRSGRWLLVSLVGAAFSPRAPSSPGHPPTSSPTVSSPSPSACR